MSSKGELQRLIQTRLTRRSFLKGVGAAAALSIGGSILEGCSTLGSSSSPSGSQGVPKTLTLLMNGGQIREVAGKHVIEPFQKKYNAKIEVVEALSGEMVSKLRAEKSSPTADVAIIDEPFAIQARSEGLLEKIDKNNVPNLKDLDERVLNPDGWGPGVHSNPVVFGYNKDVFKLAPPQSWKDLWDPKYKGMIAPLSIDLFGGVLSLLMANKLNGGTYENVDPGFEALKKLQPNVRKWQHKIAESRALLKENVLIVFSNNLWQSEINEGHNVGYVYPKEGAPGPLAVAEVVKGTKNKTLAEQFINEYISPEAQAGIAKDMYLAVTNKKAPVPDDVKKRIPQNVVYFDSNKIAKFREGWAARWAREIKE